MFFSADGFYSIIMNGKACTLGRVGLHFPGVLRQLFPLSSFFFFFGFFNQDFEQSLAEMSSQGY